MNQFNNLPPEIIEIIFKKVNFNDLINLRIVDRRFKQICDQFKIKQLNVADSRYYNNFWFYTKDPTYLKEENLIKISKFLNYKSIFRLDKYLRRLTIYFYENQDFNIPILNEFKLLEQLNLSVYRLNNNYKLSLENLRIVSVFIAWFSNFKLTFDTNKLFAFKSTKFTRLDQFIFNYPDKILFYETNYYNDEIKNFNNLQYLKFRYYFNSISSDIVSKFKNLNILDLDIKRTIIKSCYDDLKQFTISILKKKKKLRRSELEIYLFGVKLNNQNQINQIKWSDDREEFNSNVLEFQIKNYDLLKNNCYKEINYCNLIKLIKIIPSSFTDKFPYIHRVEANGHIDNEEQFIKFLNAIPYLTKLELENCGLTKSFYAQLIDLVYLNYLKFLIIKEKEDLELNFNFILNLEHLIFFETNQTIDNYIDLIDKSLKVNKDIQRYIFKFDTKNYVSIFFNNYTDDYKISFFYLDDNFKEIENSRTEDLNSNDLILKLKDLKF